MPLFRFKKQASDTPPLRIVNTLSHEKEVFVPLKRGQVKMYSCGPTVYDFATIGNLRSFVFADILKRTFLLNGYSVNHTMNLTDFGHLSGDGDSGEDKMMIALERAGKPRTLEAMKAVAGHFADAFKRDMLALGNIPPSQYTPASEYMNEEIALVKVLHEKGYTYQTSDGIYFDISRFPTYGTLGNIDLAALKEGARIEANPEKKHPADFAVWKFGDLGWESPWGKGFPGWHIECTAMAFATLGKQIDVHTGGIDLAPTHHNGEIAQAESATNKSPYVRYWMHNAFITIENKRIGKSLGNAITLPQLIDRGYHPLIYRYWLLTGHYSSPMNFTFLALDGVHQAHYKLRRFIREELSGVAEGTVPSSYRTELFEALNNDLDTPKAITLLWEALKDKKLSLAEKHAVLKYVDEALGLGLFLHIEDDAKSLDILKVESLPEEVKKLVREREEARKEKRWEDADALRQAINLKGYTVEDSAKGMKITKSP